VSLLNPKVIRELRLASMDEDRRTPVRHFLPASRRTLLQARPTTADTQKELSGFSRRDADAFPILPDDRGGRPIRCPRSSSRHLQTSDELAQRLARAALGGICGSFRAAPARSVGIVTKSAASSLDWWFESRPDQGGVGFDRKSALRSPLLPGSAYVLLHHAFGEVNGKRGTGGTRSAEWAR